MESVIEKELVFPHLAVHLATVEWRGTEESSPRLDGYSICQRLSDNHAPLRIGNLPAREAFPRVRSVGFLPPACSVQMYPVEGPFRVLNCAFERGYFEERTRITREHWEQHTLALISIRNKRLEIMMQEIVSELLQPGFGHDMLIDAAGTMILVEMGRYARQLESSVARGAGQGLAPWQMRRIQERIAASLEIGYPHLAELARLCGISESHLMRSFKASTGWQIHKFIAEERLKAAKTLLAAGQLSSKEVTARLGFGSPAYFATAFRRMTGKTPSEYRRLARAMDGGSA